jgi:hypothetical protein
MKIKIIILFSILFFISFSMNTCGQVKSSSKMNIDSLFCNHFLSLDTTVVCGETRLILPTDIEFVYLIGLMSDIPFEIHSYSGHPMLTVNNLVDFKKWYIKHKKKITNEHVEKVLFFIRNGMYEDSEKKMEELKIK